MADRGGEIVEVRPGLGYGISWLDADGKTHWGTYRKYADPAHIIGRKRA